MQRHIQEKKEEKGPEKPENQEELNSLSILKRYRYITVKMITNIIKSQHH